MKTSYRHGAAVAALICSSAANAANYQGTISNVAPLDGKVFVVVQSGYFDGAASQCVSGNAMVYGVDPATPFGRTLVAVALSAKLTGKLVYAIGNGVCAVGSPFAPGNSEGLAGMDLKG